LYSKEYGTKKVMNLFEIHGILGCKQEKRRPEKMKGYWRREIPGHIGLISENQPVITEEI
jgi:hypothetical protein